MDAVSFDLERRTRRSAEAALAILFNDHDDGYASDPTYFLLDDVR